MTALLWFAQGSSRLGNIQGCPLCNVRTGLQQPKLLSCSGAPQASAHEDSSQASQATSPLSSMQIRSAVETASRVLIIEMPPRPVSSYCLSNCTKIHWTAMTRQGAYLPGSRMQTKRLPPQRLLLGIYIVGQQECAGAAAHSHVLPAFKPCHLSRCQSTEKELCCPCGTELAFWVLPCHSSIPMASKDPSICGSNFLDMQASPDCSLSSASLCVQSLCHIKRRCKCQPTPNRQHFGKLLEDA